MSNAKLVDHQIKVLLNDKDSSDRGVFDISTHADGRTFKDSFRTEGLHNHDRTINSPPSKKRDQYINQNQSFSEEKKNKIHENSPDKLTEKIINRKKIIDEQEMEMEKDKYEPKIKKIKVSDNI